MSHTRREAALAAQWSRLCVGSRACVLLSRNRRQEGEAAIGIQAAGRYLAASTKKTFPSVSAMSKYYDRLGDRFIDSASERTKAYNKATNYGYDQGAFIP